MYGAKAEFSEERKERGTVLYVPQVTEKHYVLLGEAVEQLNGYQAV